MIFIYGKGTAKTLAREMGIKRIRPPSSREWDDEGDVCICYGYVPYNLPFQSLNLNLIGDKEKELVKLQLGGLPTPQFVSAGGLARSRHHAGGGDLLRETGSDYMVERLNLTKEYRFHVFNFPTTEPQSVRAGTKVPRTPNPHPWIRSYEGGWKIDYGTPPITNSSASRALAERALEVVGYDFGAVDIGIKEDGNPVVLEVNSAPGLEGNSLLTYAKSLNRLMMEKGYIDDESHL